MVKQDDEKEEEAHFTQDTGGMVLILYRFPFSFLLCPFSPIKELKAFLRN